MGAVPRWSASAGRRRKASNLRLSATGVVTYARTSDWTSVSIAPGTRSATRFTVAAGTPAGPSTLVVVANGIASAPSTVTIP